MTIHLGYFNQEETMSETKSQDKVETLDMPSILVIIVVNSSIIKWTPISERLPEIPTTRCLVTLKNGAVVAGNYIHVIGEFRMNCTLGTGPFPETNPVIAWAPIPQGYVSEEREDT